MALVSQPISLLCLSLMRYHGKRAALGGTGFDGSLNFGKQLLESRFPMLRDL